MVRPNQRFAAIDLLRIFAATAVVVFHYAYLFRVHAEGLPLGIQSAASYGYLGVQLFFMISGFVISMSALGRTREQFAYARFVRLWPAFVLCLILTLAVNRTAGIGTILANLTMLPHLLGLPYVDDVYWSLMFEIIFYAWIAALVISRGHFVRRLRIFVVVWLALAVVGQFVELRKIKVFLILDYAPFFAVGASMFLLTSSENVLIDRTLVVVATALAVEFSIAHAYLISKHGPAWPVHANEWICGLIVAASASVLYIGTKIDLSPRLSKFAVALGGISYPLYLLHNSFGSVLVDRVGLFGLIVVAFVCYGVWRVELPIRKRLMQNQTPSFVIRRDVSL